MTRPYAELHARSAFSFLRGASFPEQLAERAAQLELPAMALCDRDGVYGAPRFYAQGVEKGVEPIVGAELTLEGDLVSTVRTAVEEGLRRHQFVPVATDADGRELRIEIRNLDYGINVGFWAGKLKVDCSLKGICQRGDARPYEKLHRSEFQESIQVVQGQQANNHYVSSAVSEALNALLNDRELMQCLASDNG